MHFLTPWWWLLLLPLAGLLILLYLLKLRRRNHVVPSIFLWEQALQDLQANAPLQKLRKNLLLFVQLLVLLLVVFALTRPAMQWRQANGRSVVLVIDVSASMRSTDVSPNRFEAAKRAAQRAVESLGMRDKMMIVAVGGGTRPLTTFTNDKRQLRDALSALQVTDTRADLRGAIDLAAGITGNKKGITPPEVLILSDGAVPLVQLPANFQLPVFQRFGKRCDNVAIVMMSVRRRVSQQGGLEGMIGIKNFSSKAKSMTLELSLDGQLLDARDISVDGNGTRTEMLPSLPKDSGVLSAKLDVNDDLAADNTANLILPKVDPVEVTLASTGNLFLKTALTLDPTLDVVEQSTAPATLPPGAVLVADQVPVTRLPAGAAALLIGSPSPAAPCNIGEEVDNPQIVDWNRHHPLMAHLNLAGIRIGKAHILTPRDGAESLIETNAGPIAIAQEKNGQRIVYVGWDLHQSDFPLNAAFPIFIGNCMNWLSGERQRAQAVNARTGDMVRFALPPELRTVKLTTPDGKHEQLEVKDSSLTLDQVRLAGVYRLTAKNYSMQFTANLFDAAESQLAPKNLQMVSGEGHTSEVAARGAMQTERELWRTLALLAIFLLCAEWWIFHKRIG